MAILLVNGTAIKDPADLQYGQQDIDSADSGRNAEGTMLRDRVATKIKLTCKWNALTPAEISNILNAVDAPSFSLTYPDAKAGTSQTKTFYVGDRTSPMYHYNNGAELWEGLSANFIEL